MKYRKRRWLVCPATAGRRWMHGSARVGRRVRRADTASAQDCHRRSPLPFSSSAPRPGRREAQAHQHLARSSDRHQLAQVADGRAYPSQPPATIRHGRAISAPPSSLPPQARSNRRVGSPCHPCCILLTAGYAEPTGEQTSLKLGPARPADLASYGRVAAFDLVGSRSPERRPALEPSSSGQPSRPTTRAVWDQRRRASSTDAHH